jgi:hypothetical protein
MGKLDDLKRLGELKRARSSAVEQRPLKPTVARSNRAAPAKPAFRKPLAKDADKTLMATKPWEAEGMSRRTWYRRRAEARKKEANAEDD